MAGRLKVWNASTSSWDYINAPTGMNANGVLAIPYGTPPTVPVAGQVLIYGDHAPATSNLIPIMTGTATPSGVASDDVHYSASDAWHTMDNGIHVGWLSDGSSLPHWLGYQFTVPTKVYSYSLRAWWSDNFPVRCPKTWQFQGSTNGSSWTTIHDRSADFTFTDSSAFYSFTVTSPDFYTYYRLYILSNQGNQYTGLGGIKMFSSGSEIGLFAMNSDGTIHQLI
jgi:hypothetical protein